MILFTIKRIAIASGYNEDKFELNKILIKAVANLGFNTEVGGHSAAAGAIILESNIDSFINQIEALMEELTN